MNALESRKLGLFGPGAAVFGSATVAAALLALGTVARADRTPEVPDSLQVPHGSKVAFRAYAVGVQIYQWNGANWVFVAPEAVLFADAGDHGEVGIHYAGPTWESRSGSKVVGARVAGATVDPSAIPWLLLRAVSSEGPGIFHRVSYIQRVNTTGGNAPPGPGSSAGQEARVPYTAEYYFYRAK
jgi:hypothetical protein